MPTPYSRVRRELKDLPYKMVGLIGIIGIALSFVVLFMVDPTKDFITWVDMYVVFVTMILLTGLFLKYLKK